MTISRIRQIAVGLCALAMTLLSNPAAAQAPYAVWGRAWVEQESTVGVASTTTSAIPGVTTDDPEAVSGVGGPSPLPGVTLEVFEASSNSLLGVGKANPDGFYNVQYTRASVANHDVKLRLSYVFEDGGAEVVGEVGPVTVNSQSFLYELTVKSESPFSAGLEAFSTAGEFVFTQVGHIEMHNIYDQQQDPADPTRWGLTKPPGLGHSQGPDHAFGRNLELYGLFEETTPARYYKINYSGPESGSIQTPLWKTNYVLTGSGVAVHRRLLGPKNVGTLTGVYELDEFLDGQPTLDNPLQNYSTFWTRSALRGIFDTDRGGGPADDMANGIYTLSVQAWDAAHNPVPAATNNFSTLSLHLVNGYPDVNLHNLQYLNGDIVLSDAAPCQGVLLNKVSSPTFDDNLQFQVTARHPVNFPNSADPTQSGLAHWQLFAWHGHNTPDGVIAQQTYPFATAPPVSQVFVTPAAITYQSCAYRFRLRAWPRITNGYHTVYVRENNWYAGIQVLGP